MRRRRSPSAASSARGSPSRRSSARSSRPWASATRARTAPALYNKLYAAGHRALVSTGHGQDTILVGETAPLGVSRRTATSAMYPKAFIRSFFKHGKRVDATAWAHHPYTKDLGPTERAKSSQSITMANFNDLGVLLDQEAAKTKRIAPGLPIIST